MSTNRLAACIEYCLTQCYTRHIAIFRQQHEDADHLQELKDLVTLYEACGGKNDAELLQTIKDAKTLQDCCKD